MVRGLTFRSCPEQGYFIQLHQREGRGAPKHHLGSFTERSVECKGCGDVVVNVLRLDTSDARLALPNASPFFELFLCLSCSLHCYSYTRQLKYLPLVPPGAIEPAPKFQPPPPGQAALHAIPERVRETRTLAREGRLDEAGSWAKQYEWERPIHQVGGEPVLLGEPIAPPECWLCGGEMPYLASIVGTDASELTMPQEISIAQQVIFFICRRCLAIVAWRDLEKID